MSRILLASLLFALLFTSLVYADCPEGTNWTVAWTDNFGNTTYTLTAPCKVYIGIPFTITAAVTDDFCLNSWVASFWSILDNGELIAGSNRQNSIWTDANGQWQRVIERTYFGVPVDHTIEFNFTDHGICSGFHHSAQNLIGSITVDPYPPSSNNPPTVNAGPDLILSSQDQVSTIINGFASDADGDILTYRWLEGMTELQSYNLVDSSGNAPLILGMLSPFTRGTHILTLEVYDGKDTNTDEVMVSIENTLPTIAPSGSGTYQIWDDILLNGTVSDYDGDLLTYRWLEGETVLAYGTVSTSFGGSPVSLPEHIISGGLSLGTHALTLEVSDGFNVVSSNITINVIDTLAPTLAPVASTNILWPTNHQMVNVEIYANVSDNSGGFVSLTVMVNCNEQPDHDGNGNIIPDFSIVQIDQQNGVIYLQLRASKAGKKNERIYTVTIIATDESGNSSSSDVQIKVPHDMRKK